MNRFRNSKLMSIRRNFRPSFARWRERRDKGAVLRYFFQKPKEDARSKIGKSVDYIGGLLLFWLAGFLLLLNLTGRPVYSLAISLLLLAAEAALLKNVLKKREKRRKIQQGFWLAGQRFMDDIHRLHPIREFKPYIRDMLNGLPGFQELTLRADIKKQHKWDEQIDMKGIYKGVPLGVKCSRPDGNIKVSPEEVRSFAGALHGEGLKNGLYITSGDFDAGVAQVTRESFRGGVKIMLVNRYGLVDLAKQAGCGVFREDLDLSGASSASKKRRQSIDVFLDSAFGTRKKAKSYFLYGLLLYGGYLILKDTTTFSLVYLLFTVINLLMGAGSLLFGKTLDQIDPLAGLGPEN